MSKNKVDWNQWLSDKETANNERMKEKMSQQGLKPYLTLEQGENTFTLLPEVPTPKVSNWGTDQEVFKVQKNGNEYNWPITVTSPLYIKIARMMPKAPIDVTVARVGVGIQTRMSLIDP